MLSTQSVVDILPSASQKSSPSSTTSSMMTPWCERTSIIEEEHDFLAASSSSSTPLSVSASSSCALQDYYYTVEHVNTSYIVPRTEHFVSPAIGWEDLAWCGEDYPIRIHPGQEQDQRATTACTPAMKRRRNKKQVRFQEDVQVRCHEVVLGCHPWARLPLELGWEYTESTEALPPVPPPYLEEEEEEDSSQSSQESEDDASSTRSSQGTAAVPRWTFPERRALFEHLLSKRMEESRVGAAMAAYLPQRVESHKCNLSALGNPGIVIDI